MMDSNAPAAPALVPPGPAAPADPAAVATPPAGAGNLDWWTRPATRWVALLAVTGVILYLCWLMLAQFVDVIMWAVVLVVVFYPVHRRLAARMKSPNLAAAVSCLLVVVAILLPLVLVTLLVVNDAADMAQYVQARKEGWLHPAPTSTVGRAMTWASDRGIPVQRFVSTEWLSDRARTMSGAIASRTLNVVGGVVGVLVQIFFVIFTMFYLFRDGPRLRNATRHVLPLDRLQSHDVFVRTKEVITASVYGSLVIATVQGVLGGVMFAVLGVPSAVLWGAVMILLCMIPMLGAFLVWVPAAIYLAVTGAWIKAIILVVWGAVVIGTVDNVLRPRLVGGRTRMHELVVFFAVLGGIQVFGVLGIVTGPAIAAVAVALFDVWRQARTPAPGVVSGAVAVGSTTGVAATVPATPPPGTTTPESAVSLIEISPQPSPDPAAPI